MSSPVFAETAADAARRQGLRRMRSVALGLLLLATAIMIATLNLDGGWAYVHAAAEAAMVGAIADWFAVTALFRHPLGLRIPHTAIIPTRKDTLARSLQDFVTENFLSEDVVRARVADAEPSRRIGEWLSDPEHSSWLVGEATALAQAALRNVKDDDIAALIETELIPRLSEEPLSELTGAFLERIVTEQAHHGLVDLLVSETHDWLADNESAVAAALGTRAPFWTPRWVDDRVIRKLHVEAMTWVGEIRDQPHHPARRALDGWLSRVARDLQTDPDLMERTEAFKRRMLAQPQVTATATSLWNALRRSLLASLEAPDSAIRVRGSRALAEFGERVSTDKALSARLDASAQDAAAFIVDRYGAELTRVITDTIERWDGREAADRIELHVGRDLQFIRINGTLVGGLAGLAIYSLGRLL